MISLIYLIKVSATLGCHGDNFWAPTELKKCTISSVRSSGVIVRFMCYEGSEGAERVKKVQERSYEVFFLCL